MPSFFNGNKTITTGGGGAILTDDTSPIEPDVSEYKLYAKGVGPVVAVSVSGESEREDLISYSR